MYVLHNYLFHSLLYGTETIDYLSVYISGKYIKYALKLQDNLDLIALAYDSFLSMFPLCHWYWTKYTDHIIRLSDAHKADKVYERAVDSTPFSTGMWVDYCCFGMCVYEDPSDVRR